MSWDEVALELERYLPWDQQVTPGTAGNRSYGIPPLPLPRLEKGVRLYDVTIAWIAATWGGYEEMPRAGKRVWDRLLMVSRTIPLDHRNATDDAILSASLNDWVQWVQSGEARFAEPNRPAQLVGSETLADLVPAPPTSHSDAEWMSIVTVLAGKSAAALVSIASDATKTTDERMRLIYAMDERVLGWNSSQWASVLRVSDAAVRKTDWWKAERPRLRG